VYITLEDQPYDKETTMRLHRIVTVTLMALLMAGAAQADFKVVQAYHQDEFSMMGQNQPATDEQRTTWIGTDRLRMDQGNTTTIVRLDTKKLYILDHEKKSYYQVDLPVDLNQLLPPGMGEQMMKMMTFDITVTPGDETKQVGEWTAKRYDMEMKSAMVTVSGTLWATDQAPVKSSDYMRLYSEVLSLQPGMDAMAEKMGVIDGFVVAQESTVAMTMMGDTSVRSTEQTESIEETDAPAGTYDPPAGYSLEELDYMEMMQNR
jgi:hypothetical protein